MKIIDLIVGIYAGYIPSTVSFNMYGDRYTAYLNSKTNRLKIEDSTQSDIFIANYYSEIEIIDDTPISKLYVNNELQYDLTPKEENKIPEKLDYCEENTFMKQKEITYLSQKERRLLDSNFKELGNKINSIIDYLKSKGE